MSYWSIYSGSKLSQTIHWTFESSSVAKPKRHNEHRHLRDSLDRVSGSEQAHQAPSRDSSQRQAIPSTPFTSQPSLIQGPDSNQAASCKLISVTSSLISAISSSHPASELLNVSAPSSQDFQASNLQLLKTMPPFRPHPYFAGIPSHPSPHRYAGTFPFC